MRAGSAVLVEGGTLRDSEIVRNYVDSGWHSAGSSVGDWGGGAVSVFNDASVVERCYIAYNELKNPGDSGHAQWARVAGLGLKAGLVRNCLIIGNSNTGPGSSASYGAGVYIRGGKFYHNTVVGNWVKGDGSHRSGVMVDAGSPDIQNNIFAFNGPNGTEGGCNIKAGTFAHNIIDNSVDYAGASDNFLLDPQFLDKANGDYRLNVLSQAIDVGAAISDVTDDYVRTVRPQGLAADLGAYERIPGADGVQVVVIATSGSITEGDDISFSSRYEGVADGATVVVRWYLDDTDCEGTAAAEGTSVTFTAPAPGAHTATVALFIDGAETPAKTDTFAFSVLPTTVYVDENGGNIYPYNTSGNAATSFESAINALAVKSGVTSTIYVAAGDYTATVPHTYAVPFKLVGAGADRVTITGVDNSRTVAFLTCNDTCEMSGVTLKGFVSAGSGGHGGALCMNRGTVKDCVFLDNNSNNGHGGAIYMTGAGLITNCTFRGNCGLSGGAVYMADGLIVDCLLTGNQPSCLNAARGGGALCLAGGTARNCEIRGNLAHAGN